MSIRDDESLLTEYTRRYGKAHATGRLSWVLSRYPENITRTETRGEFVLCMPDEYKTKCPVESYRRYYRGAKSSIAKWKLGDVPDWMS